VGDYLPVFKVGPVLADMVVSPPNLDTVPVNVVLHPNEDPARALDAVAGSDSARLLRVEQGPAERRLVFQLPPARLEAFLLEVAPLAEVAAIQLRRQMEWLNEDADWVHQSSSNGATPVFDQGLFGCGQVVAYMDSGLDFTHCSFWDETNGQPPVESCTQGASCPAGTPDMAQRKVVLYYKWSGAGDTLGDAACGFPTSGAGHGTHVGGSIAGDDSPFADCAAFTTSGDTGDNDGTAPGAKLIHQEMGESLDYVNSLGGTTYHALTVAHASGARIHSSSWGGGCCFLGLLCICSEVAYDSFARDADRALWDYPDLTALFASGNDGQCCSPPASVNSPGVAKSVITVGANLHGSSADTVASFSSYGRTNDRRTKPEVLAQGASVDSSASDGSTSGTNCSTCNGSGTSMATPTAAGLAALVREYLVRGFYPTGAGDGSRDAIPSPSGALIKALLVNGARDVSAGDQGAAPNQKEGWGRVHLDDVLHFAGDARSLWLNDATDGLATGQAAEHQIDVGDELPLKVTLVWTDYPAIENANPALVNDLRLEVVTPGGEAYTQKLPASDPPNPYADASTSGYDDRNPVEQVLIASPAAGAYTIRVRGVSVPMGPQPYALVITGSLSSQEAELIFADGFESGDLSAWPGTSP
ncbi:MAG: S8 family serine peptidase, partial [Thermoanaerobaculales bacterium]|nr:S8 family serine peptidase [Thermoanaerobaculales bacterium]